MKHILYFLYGSLNPFHAGSYEGSLTNKLILQIQIEIESNEISLIFCMMIVIKVIFCIGNL